MSNLIISPSDLKNYPHFDKQISLREINDFLSDPENIATHKFYPFLLKHDEWQPYRQKTTLKPSRKSRPIRYASRKDAYVFTHYRRILSEKYEQRLIDLGIKDCPIAYRKIKKYNGQGKCNIDFAKDAFDEIKRIKNCLCIAIDISSFFENLCHEKIKKEWCKLLKVNRLPNDHYSVYKNITKYHVVDTKELYQRLGFIQEVNINGHKRMQYTRRYSEIPKQLCSPKEFREKVAGYKSGLTSIIKSNTNEDGTQSNSGVPQGAPISDIIANFYLTDFDKEMNEYAIKNNGKYMRYSDDILLIIDSKNKNYKKVINHITKKLSLLAPNLSIKEEKTSIVKYKETSNQIVFEHISGPQGKNGLEYLGFRFDGTHTYIRDATISRFYRKISKNIKISAHRYVEHNKNKDLDAILKDFNYSKLMQKFYKVDKSEFSLQESKTWTFYTYVKRSIKTFGEESKPIPKQIKNFKKIVRERTKKALSRAHNKIPST